MRIKLDLNELITQYQESQKVSRKPKKVLDKYYGLEECIKNVHKCNMSRKLAYY